MDAQQWQRISESIYFFSRFSVLVSGPRKRFRTELKWSWRNTPIRHQEGQQTSRLGACAISKLDAVPTPKHISSLPHFFWEILITLITLPAHFKFHLTHRRHNIGRKLLQIPLPKKNLKRQWLTRTSKLLSQPLLARKNTHKLGPHRAY